MSRDSILAERLIEAHDMYIKRTELLYNNTDHFYLDASEAERLYKLGIKSLHLLLFTLYPVVKMIHDTPDECILDITKAMLEENRLYFADPKHLKIDKTNGLEK